jgi:quinol monooxygenase YgiN
MPAVRISLGRLDADVAGNIQILLDQSQASLIPAIKTLRGNLGYHAGIDRDNNVMSHVSVWESLDDAMQMASFREMLDLAAKFINAGVRFERPITNHQVIWVI